MQMTFCVRSGLADSKRGETCDLSVCLFLARTHTYTHTYNKHTLNPPRSILPPRALIPLVLFPHFTDTPTQPINTIPQCTHMANTHILYILSSLHSLSPL